MVRFRVRLTNGLHTARRCTCSYCRMRVLLTDIPPRDGRIMFSTSRQQPTFVAALIRHAQDSEDFLELGTHW
jgi:hypothetical protein